MKRINKKFLGGHIMKTLTIILTGSALILASCGSAGYTSYSEYDDGWHTGTSGNNQEVDGIWWIQAS